MLSNVSLKILEEKLSESDFVIVPCLDMGETFVKTQKRMRMKSHAMKLKMQVDPISIKFNDKW